MRHDTFISFSVPAGSNAFDLTKSQIVVDESDHEGVKIAARILGEDFARVTGNEPSRVVHHAQAAENLQAETAILIGCIETSQILQALEKNGKADFSSIKGKWECFTTSVVDYPLPGCERALIIAGSNKRGAIYGVYALSEQMGVSP